jgi:hypothetical protein
VLQTGGSGLLDGLAVKVLMADPAAAELGFVGDVVVVVIGFSHAFRFRMMVTRENADRFSVFRGAWRR